MAQTVQGNLVRPKGSENLVFHRRPQNSFSNLFFGTLFWWTSNILENVCWTSLFIINPIMLVGCALVHKHWPGRISAILYLNIEAVIRFNNTVGIVSKHYGLIYAFNVQKKII